VKQWLSLPVAVVLVLGMAAVPALAVAPTLTDYDDVTLSGGFQAGHLSDWWDLTAGDLVLSFTYDGNGLVDELGGAARAAGEFGVRGPCLNDYSPAGRLGGVWLATDYDWAANTFDPDPAGVPVADLDDKLVLQRAGDQSEAFYDLPSPPPNPSASHRIWFDRDGVAPSQASSPLAVDGGTYNTYGTYDVVIRLHATSSTTGEAHMMVNGLDQGFEMDGNWGTMELSPAGLTFKGELEHLQVFYALNGYGALHTVAFRQIRVQGVRTTAPQGPCGLVYLPLVWR